MTTRCRRASEIELTKAFAGYDAGTIFKVKHGGKHGYVCFTTYGEELGVPADVARWRRATRERYS